MQGLPKALVVIRHAEKKTTSSGKDIKHDPGLSPEGEARARYLADWLTASGPLGKVLADITGKPAKDALFDAVYAMAQEDKKHSDRPRLTVLPYVEKMSHANLLQEKDWHRSGALDTEHPDDNQQDGAFKFGHEKDLVHHITNNYSGKVVLVCWEHHAITNVRTT